MAQQAQALRFPKPNPKQALFFKERHKYVAFGGARGGGKSWAVRVKAIMLALRYPGIKIMIVRRSYPELRANHINFMRQMVPRSIAKYNSTDKELIFACGSVILFRYCASEKDLPNYQGTEVDVLFIDEATHFSEDVFKILRVCVRGVNNFPKRIYLTCNPGGPGHSWVKRLFIDRDFREEEDPAEYTFIQSKVDDNHALKLYQPDYVKQLDALPPRLKKAWRDGDWNIFEGQFFEEFTNDPAHYKDRRWTHVIEPFDPPATWKRLRSYDHGYAKPFSVGWWALSPDGVLYRILELYGCRKGEADVGVRWIPDEIFEKVQRIEQEHPYLKGYRIDAINSVADTSIWEGSDRGVSIADTAAKYGIYFSKAEKARIPGWMQVHYRLAFDHNGYPMMYIFNTCADTIRTLPTLQYSETIPEDLDTRGEDHIADDIRYMCMMNPLPPRISVPAPQIPEDDPLNLWADRKKMRRYDFYRI